MAGALPHSHSVGEHEPNMSTLMPARAPAGVEEMTICLTLRELGFVLTHVPIRRLSGAGWVASASAPAGWAATAPSAATARAMATAPRRRDVRGSAACDCDMCDSL